MSYFDVGKCPPERTSENFYRGLVLGLIVSLRDQYRIVSNRESGQGRYDIAMYPLERNKDAFIMEFKVFDAKKERSLEQTAANALKQIEEKNYEADLIAAGIGWGQIYKPVSYTHLVDAYPVNEIAESVAAVSESDTNVLVDEYYEKYDILLEGRDPEEFRRHVAVQAQIAVSYTHLDVYKRQLHRNRSTS